MLSTATMRIKIAATISMLELNFFNCDKDDI